MVRKFFRNITRINRNNLDNPVIFVLPTYLPTYLPTFRSFYKRNKSDMSRACSADGAEERWRNVRGAVFCV